MLYIAVRAILDEEFGRNSKQKVSVFFIIIMLLFFVLCLCITESLMQWNFDTVIFATLLLFSIAIVNHIIANVVVVFVVVILSNRAYRKVHDPYPSR